METSEKKICHLARECESNEECGADLYFLSGYATADMESQLPDWKFPRHRVFECDAKYEKLDHNLYDVVKEFRKGVLENSDKKKIDLVAYSWGGFVGQEYAQQYPDDVNKLVLLGSFSRVSELFPLGFKALGEITHDPRFGESMKTLEHAMSYDLTRNEILAPTFAYNCLMDIFLGIPPIVKGGALSFGMCAHNWSVSDSMGKTNDEVNAFLDG